MALTLTNCSQKELDLSEQIANKEGTPFQVIAMPEATKTTMDGFATYWVTDDAINLFHADANATTYINDGQFTIANTETGEFSGTVTSSPVKGTAYDWYALYPYDSQLTAINDSERNGTNRYYTLGSRSNAAQTQSSVGSTDHLADQPLYGVKKAAVYNGSAPFISMNQLISVAAVTITNSTSAAINISSVEFTGTEDIVGTYYFNILGHDVVYTKSGDNFVSNTAKLAVTNGTLAKDATGVFYIAIKPFTAPSGETISVKATTDADVSQTKVFNLTKDYTFGAGKIKTVKMDFTEEPVDLTGTYYQITSVDDITADGYYMIVMPDVSVTPNDYIAVKAGAGKTGNAQYFNSGFTVDDDGLLSYTNPDATLVWGVQSISADGGINFRYTDGSIWYGISFSSSDVYTNGGNGYWVPTLLSSNCFQLTSGDRYLSRGTTDVVKAYLTTSSSKYDQVATNRARGQYACAWAILKLGAAPVTTPKIVDVAVSDLAPRGASDNTVSVTTKNTESAVKVLSDI